MRYALVIDESPIARHAARAMLEARSYRVNEVGDGMMAVVTCATGMPDLVILELNLSEMSPVQMIRKLRSLPKGHHPRVLLCSAETDFDRIAAALDAGADEYLMKPYDAALLGEKLRQLGLE